MPLTFPASEIFIFNQMKIPEAGKVRGIRRFLPILAFRVNLLLFLGPTNPWNYPSTKLPSTLYPPPNTHTRARARPHKQNRFYFPYLKAPAQNHVICLIQNNVEERSDTASLVICFYI